MVLAYLTDFFFFLKLELVRLLLAITGSSTCLEPKEKIGRAGGVTLYGLLHVRVTLRETSTDILRKSPMLETAGGGGGACMLYLLHEDDSLFDPGVEA